MTTAQTVRNGVLVLLFALLCVGIMQFFALNMGQGSPPGSLYTVHGVFSDADGLPTAADVRVSGVTVGKVTDVSHDPEYPGETVVTMQITNGSAAPFYGNGYAMVRPKTLLGEKYVDVTVGDSADSEAIPDNGYLPISQTGKDVSNDEIFNSFDARARQEQQQVLAALDAGTVDRAGDIQALIPQFTQVVNNLQPLADVYEKDQPQVDAIFVQLNTMVRTLADEHVQIGGLLKAGGIALGAIAQRDQALLGTLEHAASFAAEINHALAPTVASQRQAISELAPSLRAQSSLLNLVVAPQAECGGKPCGIDEIFTGTLLGSVGYPNNQLTITTRSGELVTDEWDAMFSRPSGDNRGLAFVLSLHGCQPPFTC